MRIGIIVASHHEEAPFYDIFGPCGRICIPDRNFGNIPMWRTTRDAEVYLINSGAGEILAAIGTQFLIDTIGHEQDLYKKMCEELLNFEIEDNN